MNTHVQSRSGFALLSRLRSAIIAGYKTWRAEQAERAALEALEALGPEVLKDIGVTIVKTSNGPTPIAQFNPHLIATRALSEKQPTKRAGS